MLSDLRLALRSFRRNGSTSLAIVAILALGMTANTSLFAVLESLVVGTLPFPDAEELVRIQAIDPERAGRSLPIFPAAFYAMAESPEPFGRLAAIVSGRDLNLQVEGALLDESIDVRGAVVSADLFSILGAEPAAGRLFRSGENEPGQDRVAVVGHRLWRSRFASDPGLLDSSLVVNDQVYTVVGVLGEGQEYPFDVDLWLPNPSRAPEIRNLALPVHSYFDVVGRLPTDQSFETANERLGSVYRAVTELYPRAATGDALEMIPLHHALSQRARETLSLLQWAALAVLLIACVNVAGLLLVRSLRRRGEMALRAVLGASPGRLTRQLTVEYLTLFVAGGVAGIVGAHWTLRLLAAATAGSWLRHVDVGLRPSTVLFGLGVSVLAGLVFGALPSLQATRTDLASIVQRDLAPGAGSRHRLGNAVVIFQISLAAALLVGAGLLIRSLVTLQSQPLGFEPQGLTTAQITLLDSRYGSREGRSEFMERVRSGLEALPDVTAASGSQYFFLTDGSYTNRITALGADASLPGDGVEVAAALVLAGYFETLGTPLEGSGFSEEGLRGQTREVVVNRSVADSLWPDQEALGRRLQFEGRWWTVVGVAADLESPATSSQRAPALFLPWRSAMLNTGQMTFLIRSRGDSARLADDLRDTVRDLDPAQSVAEVISIEHLLADERSPQSYSLKLLGAFAACATVLAGIGIYALLSFALTHRRRELGIRMSLGAGRSAIGWTIARHALGVGLGGLGLGLALGLFVSRGLGSLLLGIEPWDVWSWTAAVLVTVSMVGLAAWLPIRRAAHLDPAALLRTD